MLLTARRSPNRSSAQLTIRADQPGAKIDANIYGQFMEHLGRNVYEGIWVGEDSTIPNTRGFRNDMLAALKKLQVPVLRWPGGCFADEYHWRDGIGERDKRPHRVNTFWGGVIEPNEFGTHEFFELAEMLGAKTYLAVNVGSGTVQEMSQWVEYITSPSQSALANERRANGRDKPWKLDYVGVGNEPWGCGGDMRPEYYADEYKKFALNIKTPRGQPAHRSGQRPVRRRLRLDRSGHEERRQADGRVFTALLHAALGQFRDEEQGPGADVQRSRLDHHAQAHARRSTR